MTTIKTMSLYVLTLVFVILAWLETGSVEAQSGLLPQEEGILKSLK